MRKTIAFTMAFALSTFASPLFADEADPEKIIKYRQNFMSAIKEHNSNIKSIVNGDAPFKDQLSMHVDTLQKMFDKVGTLFPEGSDFGETSAKDAVWEQPEKFQQAVKDAQQAIADFKAVTARGDLEAAADAHKQFSKAACAGCHRPFRKKDD
jgi:cytochrome c556